MSSTSTNNHSSSSSSSAFRVNYSNYVADITGSPKSTRHSATTGIGHHINPLHNPYPNRQNQPTQPTGVMPQYGGGSDKCARCSKTVYIAEKKVGAGRSFHSSCFSCYTCKRKLDSTGLSEHKGEIYCKSCYTKQFGAHGLISGVTMSTEQTTTREVRRPSYGNELDAAGTTHPYPGHPTYSSENVFRDQHTSKPTETSINRSPQRNSNVVPEPQSPARKSTQGVNAMVDTAYRRSPSPVRKNNSNNDGHRSSYVEDDDRNKYVYEGQKMSYGSGTSALVDIPVITQNKPAPSTLDRFQTSTEPSRDFQRGGSRSPTMTSNDSYQRQYSRERSTDPTDQYGRLSINDDNSSRNNRMYTNDNPLVSQHSSSTRNYSHASTYESKYQSTGSNSSGHSRESSPINQQNRSPSPTSAFTSTTTRTTSSTYRTETSPSSSGYTPQQSYRNSDYSSTNTYADRRSPSPQSNPRTSSGLTEFVSKTNLAGTASSSSTTTSNKNSTLGSLVGNFRSVEKSNDDDDWID